MNDYKNFGYYFDDIMSQIDYNDWLEFTLEYLKKNDKVLDLACGSGTLAMLLNTNGYEVDGLDLSESMINIAKEKAKMNHNNINFYVEDMTSFKLDKKYNVITCYFDSLNHLSTYEMVTKTFDRVWEHLEDDGLFIFDIFSLDAYKNSPGQVSEEALTCHYDWKIENLEPNILHHHLKIKDGENEYNEDYYEYYYSLESMIFDPRFRVLQISGDFLDYYDNESGRLIIVMQKKRDF